MIRAYPQKKSCPLWKKNLEILAPFPYLQYSPRSKFKFTQIGQHAATGKLWEKG